MSIRITYGGKVKEIPAKTVDHICATRFHGGDINVGLRLDGNQDHTFLATKEKPTILIELVGIQKVEHVLGPMTANYTTTPISYFIKRGSAGGVFRF